MAFYEVLYWQHIPTQIKCWDDSDELRTELSPWFMEEVDRVAQTKGLTSSDDYLAQWKWGDEEEREGTAAEVTEALTKEFLEKFGRK